MEIDLAAIESRDVAASGERWELTESARVPHTIKVIYASGFVGQLTVTRDRAEVTREDLIFVANSRLDAQRLVAHLQGRQILTRQELDEIEAHLGGVSPAPWMAFLESDGGVGGCNVISVSHSDDQPDLYLWLGAEIAPDADFEFVAHARQEIPQLLGLARAQDTA